MEEKVSSAQDPVAGRSVPVEAPSGRGDADSRPPRVIVRYWAGARARAGVDEDAVTAASVGEALDAVTALHAGLDAVAEVSSLLVDGRTVGREHRLVEGDVVEVLPPFAGG